MMHYRSISIYSLFSIVEPLSLWSHRISAACMAFVSDLSRSVGRCSDAGMENSTEDKRPLSLTRRAGRRRGPYATRPPRDTSTAQRVTSRFTNRAAATIDRSTSHNGETGGLNIGGDFKCCDIFSPPLSIPLS
ncbi:hypothetical protein F2P81_005281 [Scophthalmus maximus]|uniref:Uncharacterized protein n=1 Tax=Scophthalmus maximus TaxID=52904 RepID=A0A6A4TA65_SCOMX|nr:hypothetical protein F2P81_005281 [Scophthalmus maximus]